MIFVTQGHGQSIGPEVFFKALFKLPAADWKNFTFVAQKSVIEQTLTQLMVAFHWDNGYLILSQGKLSCILIDHQSSSYPPSTVALDRALTMMGHQQDILLTLPTSKDQLIFKDQLMAGYTEYLRHRFNNQDVAMLFMAPDDLTLLVTDHLPLKRVPQVLTTELIVGKVKQCLDGLAHYFNLPQEVLFAGINPHCGENGILGDEDLVIAPAIEKLSALFPALKFLGPYSADTLHFHKRAVPQLKVYMYHDQGLPLFKALHGTVGLNISLGLPFLRMSVDHGTAFELFGKNQADASGALFLLQSALICQKRLLS